jgi:hypothetical protein
MPASSSLYDLLLQTDGSRRHAGQAINLDTTATLTAAVSGAIDSSANTPGDEGEIFSARVRGLIPASSASSENDHHQINLNGTAVMSGTPLTGKTFTATKSSRQESRSTEQMRLSVSISRTLSKKLKLLAHDQEMTVSALLLELIKAEAHKYDVNGA